MRKVEIILFSKSVGICQILYYCYGEFIFDPCFKISLLDLRMKNSHFKKTVFFTFFFFFSYEVWLGNSRGSTYSKKHVKYTTKDAAFWNFR